MPVQDPIGALLGPWSMGFNFWSIFLRVALTALLSAVVGWERSSKRHSAGLRTFILVSLAATVAALIDEYLQGEITIISAAAVVGAAMLSGNSILFSSKSQIKGLTTSAGLWGCALIGLATGAGLYTLTLLSFAALMICLSLLPQLEKALKDRSNHFEIHLELKHRSDLQDFVATIRRLGMRIDDIESNPAYLNSGLSVYSVSLTIFSPELKKYKTHAEIIQALSTLEYVSYVEEMS